MSTTQTPATEARVTGEGDASVAGQLALDLSPLVLLVALQVATMVLGSVQQAVLR